MKPSLYIIVEGGVVQDICSDNPKIVRDFLERVTIIDYDIEGADESDITKIQQSSGDIADALISDCHICALAKGVEILDKEE